MTLKARLTQLAEECENESERKVDNAFDLKFDLPRRMAASERALELREQAARLRAWAEVVE